MEVGCSVVSIIYMYMYVCMYIYMACLAGDGAAAEKMACGAGGTSPVGGAFMCTVADETRTAEPASCSTMSGGMLGGGTPTRRGHGMLGGGTPTHRPVELVSSCTISRGRLTQDLVDDPPPERAQHTHTHGTHAHTCARYSLQHRDPDRTCSEYHANLAIRPPPNPSASCLAAHQHPLNL